MSFQLSLLKAVFPTGVYTIDLPRQKNDRTHVGIYTCVLHHRVERTWAHERSRTYMQGPQ